MVRELRIDPYTSIFDQSILVKTLSIADCKYLQCFLGWKINKEV